MQSLFVRNQPPKGWILRITIIVAVVAYIAALLGEFIFPTLLEDHPLALVALNPTNKNLLLVNGDEFRIDAGPYYVVGFLRHLVTDPVYYLLGFWFGERAITWVSKKSKSFGSIVEEGESSLKFFAYAMVFISPVSFVCALAGAVGMKLRTFFALNIAGTITTLVVVRRIGFTFGGGIDRVVNFISEYRWQALIVTGAIVAFTLFRDFRPGSKSEVDFLKEVNKKE